MRVKKDILKGLEYRNESSRIHVTRTEKQLWKKGRRHPRVPGVRRRDMHKNETCIKMP